MPMGGVPSAPANSGFPAAVIPPLAAALALILTTAYATAHFLLIEGGSIDPADVFLTAAAPTLLASPFAGYESLADWLEYAPFGGGWAIAIPLLAVAALTAGLLSRTEMGVGGRLTIGGLACVPLALFTGLLTLLAHLLVDGGLTYYYGLGVLYGLGEMVLKAGGGAAIVGLLGGLLGGMASLAIRPPRAVRVLHFHGPPG